MSYANPFHAGAVAAELAAQVRAQDDPAAGLERWLGEAARSVTAPG